MSGSGRGLGLGRGLNLGRGRGDGKEGESPGRSRGDELERPGKGDEAGSPGRGDEAGSPGRGDETGSPGRGDETGSPGWGRGDVVGVGTGRIGVGVGLLGSGRGQPGQAFGRGESIGGGIGHGAGRGRGMGLITFPSPSISPSQSSECIVVEEEIAAMGLADNPFESPQDRPQVGRRNVPSPPKRTVVYEEMAPRGRGQGRGTSMPIFGSLPRLGSPPRAIEIEEPGAVLAEKEKSPSPEPQAEAQPEAVEMPPVEGSPPPSVTSGTASVITAPESEGTKKVTFKPVVVKMGERGRKALFASNFIKIDLEAGKGMVEYRVDFEPDLESLAFRKRAIRVLEGNLGSVRMFDGQTLFLPEELPQTIVRVPAAHPSNPAETVTVIIKFVKKKETKDSVQFYNILLNRVMESLSMVRMRDNFYDVGVTHQIPQHKLQIWPGFCVSVDVQEGGLMLCLDSSHKVLREETALDILNQIRNSGNPEWKQKYEESILGEVVLTKYNNNSYRVDEVLWGAEPSHTFPKRGVEISFIDYYKQQYNLNIRDLGQPLLMSKVKPKKNDPNQEMRTICLVPEFCTMTGLTSEHTQNFQIMKDIAAFTRLSPQQRVNGTLEWIRRLLDSKAARAILSDWGLSVQNVPMQIEGRIMSGPSITFSDRLTVKEVGPDFGRESGANCYQPVHLKKWAVLVGQRDTELAKRMLDSYRQVCSQLGIRFSNAEVVPMRQTTVADYSRQVRELTKNKGEFQFVVAIFGSQRDDIYAAFKKGCLTERRTIASQVILAKTLRNDKRLRSVMVKVALQINCKLGGAIWSLNIPMKEKVMCVGIDVNHDPTKRNPSITAMVCALDNGCTQYYSRAVVQRPHQEMVDALKALFIDALQAFDHFNTGMPDRIIVFRDGIGNSQLDTSAQHEVQQFLDAIKDMCPTLKYFTFVVVQKRLNERFYMVTGGRNDNPTPGSVIDHTVTRRYYYDYFVVSQLVRQGTVTPTHYIVIHDRGDVKPDLIQKFSYALSFMYYNWPGTIRVPAVCQYAHKLAFLIGQHVKMEPSKKVQKFLYYL